VSAQTDESSAPSVAQWVADIRGRSAHGRLGKSASRMLATIVREPHFASYATTGELATRANINPSSVTRVSQALGYEGWPDLRGSLREVYVRSVSADGVEARPSSASGSVVEQLIQHDIENVSGLQNPKTRAAIEAVGARVARSRRILVVGSGLGSVPADVFGHLGLIAGLDVRVALGAATSQIAAVQLLGAGDCLVAVNVWRTTRTLRQLVALARSRAVAVCLLTDIEGSRLEAHADEVVVASTASAGPAPSLVALTSVAHAVLLSAAGGDALAHAHGVEQAWDAAGLIDDDE